MPVSTPPIDNGVVVIEDGRIVHVGGTLEDVHADSVVDLGSAVLIPGLVNTHSHLELTAFRGFLEGLHFREWLQLLNSARNELLNKAALHDSAVAGIHEGLGNGITTFGDATASGASLRAMRECGVRGIAYLETFGPDPRQRDASMRELRRGVEELSIMADSRVRVGVSPHAPYSVSAALFAEVARFAIDEELPVCVHVAESNAEMLLVRDGVGPFAERLKARGIGIPGVSRSPVSLLESTGLLDTRPLLVHAIHVDDGDLNAIARHGASIAHCPVSNAKLGHGIAPLGEVLDAKIATGLGSDSVASNNRMDMLGEARFAALLHAARSGRADSLSAHSALELATLGGARALGIGHETGSIEVGKAADLVAFPVDEDTVGTVFDPVVTLVHQLAGAVSARLVMVDGEVRVVDGTLIDSDPELGSRMVALGSALRAWRAERVEHA